MILSACAASVIRPKMRRSERGRFSNRTRMSDDIQRSYLLFTLLSLYLFQEYFS
jgi:hypothetical protein